MKPQHVQVWWVDDLKAYCVLIKKCTTFEGKFTLADQFSELDCEGYIDNFQGTCCMTVLVKKQSAWEKQSCCYYQFEIVWLLLLFQFQLLTNFQTRQSPSVCLFHQSISVQGSNFVKNKSLAVSANQFSFPTAKKLCVETWDGTGFLFCLLAC